MNESDPFLGVPTRARSQSGNINMGDHIIWPELTIESSCTLGRTMRVSTSFC